MSLAKAIGHGWQQVIQPGAIDEVKRAWNHSAETGEDFNMEIQLKRKSDNMYRWHLSRITAILNDEGKVTSWVGAAIDIHDQKTKEQVKDEFIGIASHELKTPLTTAKAYIQLLQMGMEKTNDKDLIFAKKAGASIDRLNDLIGELLDVSKIQNGKLDLNITTFNFNEMVADAVEEMQYASPIHSIILSGEIKEPVTGDKERLKQVVINLLSNAVKYSPKAKEVFINIIQKNGEIEVSIKDNGIGIRKQSLERIFERYYREEQRAVHFQGLGIGYLFLMKLFNAIMVKYGLKASLVKGSTFYFTVPI